MTRDDTLSMLKLLKAAYPSFYAKMTAKDAISVVDLWSEMFADDHVDVVKVALKSLIATHSGFPPDIADVKAEIKKITEAAVGAKTDAELWAQLEEAVTKHSAYAHECNEAFKKLDPIVQSYVGSPSALHDMGLGDSKTFHTVTRGLFMKALPAMRQRIEYSAALPPGVKEHILALTQKTNLNALLPDENETRNNVLNALEGMKKAT